MTIALTMAGMKGPKGDPGQINGMFDISHPKYGATGGSDDTLAFENAVDDASVKGGVVYVPPGLWRAQGLPALSNVRYVGAGWNATTIKLVDGATEPLFNYDTANTCEMAGWSYMALEGIGASGPDGIDMSAATSWQFSTNEGLRITNFRKGVIGSQNDRRPFFSGCQFWSNDAGFYVLNNHPHFSLCDIRDNNYGITGLTIYDMQIDQTVIIRNNYGLVPDAGGSISQTLITNTSIFGNYILGSRVGTRVFFDGCLLVAGLNQDAASVGVEFVGAGSQWNGGVVRGEGVNGFGDYAFVINTGNDVAIRGAYVNIDNFVRTNPAITVYRRIQIQNNFGTIRGRLAKLDISGTNGVQSTVISGNTIEIPATGGLLTGSDGIIEVQTASTVSGNNITDNCIHCLDAAYAAYAIQGDLRSAVVSGNLIRQTSGVNATNSDINTLYAQNRLPSGAQNIVLTGSITWDPASLNDGQRASTTVTVTNASSGDHVVVSHQLSLLGCQLWGEVTASNTVTVYLENRTGGVVNVGSGTLRAMVFKRY